MNRRTTGVLASLLLVACMTVLRAQEILPPDRNQLLSGDAAGQTLVAEKNGYPTPQKLLSFKDQLGLTKDQVRKINEMMTNTPVSATVRGQDIIDAEDELSALFASGSINEKTLRTKLERLGKMRADLRFIHLQVYVKEKQILSANQWERLKELWTREVK
jgi:Spy/CpxP family protein refolding chaperone